MHLTPSRWARHSPCHSPYKRPERCPTGFTLLELLITLTLVGVLLALALPSLATWSRHAAARSTADALQNGLRLAQSEAVRRNRQVMLSLTHGQPVLSAAAAANGRHWVVRTVPFPGEAPQFIEGGALQMGASDVAVTSDWASVCFNSFGRLVANAQPGADTGSGVAIAAGACKVPAAGATATYDITPVNPRDGTDRRLRITVALGGQIRLCDLNRALSTSPDGCS